MPSQAPGGRNARRGRAGDDGAINVLRVILPSLPPRDAASLMRSTGMKARRTRRSAGGVRERKYTSVGMAHVRPRVRPG